MKTKLLYCTYTTSIQTQSGHYVFLIVRTKSNIKTNMASKPKLVLAGAAIFTVAVVTLVHFGQVEERKVCACMCVQ